ncbi:MAG: hypothetical protein IJU02_07195 [Lachnospiraceae bacterium]|nr:hypothetical protein [Lachnospiraceae bacterium]
MKRVNFTEYDVLPQAMVDYMRHYGPHFNRKLVDFALSHMFVDDDGREMQLTPYTREDVNKILETRNIKLKNNQLYDAVYVANMCKADFLGSSIPDEQHLAKYIKDVIDDPDGYDGIVFNRWYADMSYTGIAIDWEDML